MFKVGLLSAARKHSWRQQRRTGTYFYLHLTPAYSYSSCHWTVMPSLLRTHKLFPHLVGFSPAQVQHIVTETRDKIMQYKSKMADEADLRRRLASLEESVELHEHMKRQVTRRS